MNNGAITMKEYEVLEQEILDHQKRREQLFLFTITVLGVVIGFALKAKGIPFIVISFIPYFLIYNFCHGTYINSSHIISIGTYIRHFIESKHNEALHWQTVWDMIAKVGVRSSGYWFIFSLIASIVTCIGAILLIWFPGELSTPAKQPEFGITFCLVFTSFHILICFLCILKGVWKIHWGNMNKKAREYWDNKWTEIKNQIYPHKAGGGGPGPPTNL